MGNRRFSVTTVVLVVALLATLFGGGHLVNQPPPKPAEEVEKQHEMTPEQKEMYEKMKTEKDREYKEQLANPASPVGAKNNPPPGPNPDTTDPTGGVWTGRVMGKQGEKQADEQYARDKKKWDKWLKT